VFWVRRAAKSPAPVGGEAPVLRGSAVPALAVGGEMGMEDI
jgi:hypothetical protein